ncbi:MAG: hypothetical protein VXZ96_07445 [Myxococcota bacterium]|nr:hypothetical protein [Myxococcota bacterium]
MLFILIACNTNNKSSDSQSDAETDSVSYYQDVAPILANNCVSCHRPEGGAPFPLDTYETVTPLGTVIESSVQRRSMPPFHADNSGECQTFEHSPWLTNEEVDTISHWVQAGMPEGEVIDIELPSFETEPFEQTHSVSFEPYEAQFDASPDDYRCFIVDPQVDQIGYLTGFEVLPSNRDIAHHMILYAPVSQAALNQAYAKDDAEPGPGYSCFGDAGVDSRMIAPWAPGSDQWFYPEGTGIVMEEGQILILQMHYSNASEETVDSTTVNLHIQDEVENQLWTEFFVHGNIAIPPNTETHVETLNRQISYFSGYDGPILLEAIGPHLHKLGVAGSAKLIRADGSEECLIDVPYYDFNWQRVYTFQEPILLQPNDRLEIECVYDSTGVDSMTYWGDGTNDEMCLMTVFATLPE